MSRPVSRTSSPTRPTRTGMSPSTLQDEPSDPTRTQVSPSRSDDSPTRSSPTLTPSEATPNTSTSSNGHATSSTTPYAAYYAPWLRQPPNQDPTYQNAPLLSEYLEANFVPSVVPLPEEYAAKEQARQYLEKLVHQIAPGAKLLPFGSMANGFALKNSDMDLCCFLGKDTPARAASELVEELGSLIERETNFYVKMLPRARIPIIKINMPATPTIPEGMACDIGFENRLALENTRLLLTYAMIDPRVRTLVLFLKVWTKRRKLNSPYRGTLSSYGYSLLVIHFLLHVKQPPLIPNLQRLPLPTSVPLEDLTYEGHDISFFDDLDQLPTYFQPQNVESTGELLIDFFKYFANSFDYAKSVISVRSERGTLGKEEKGWNSDIEFDPEMIVRDLHKLCIEDPFQLDYNVARTVTKDGLYTIRGEFMRAVRILTTAQPRNTQTADRVTSIVSELCAEREDFLLMHPPPDHHKQQYQHQHPHPLHSSALHPTAPISKSPRRRSAPSPQLRPAPPHPQSHHPSTNQQYVHAPIQGPGIAQSGWQPANASGGGQLDKGPEEALGLGPGTQGTPEPLHRPSPVASTSTNLHPNSQFPPRRQHLQPPSYPRPNPPSTIQPQSQQHSPVPSSVASSAAGDLLPDRRSSWDNTQERYQPAVTNGGGGGGGDQRLNVATPPSGSSSGYDLHRFFQNPPSSSASDAGAPSASPVPHPRTVVSLTAPSSPDLAPAYFPNHGYNNHSTTAHYVGRSPYRYPSSHYPSTSTPASGPRHATSVPRNPHTSHHAYTNPYAASPAPAYPLTSSISTAAAAGSTGTSGTSTPPYPPYPLASSGLVSTSPAPAPIFPAEDRERIARASSIMFGNFPELLPLPSYAHYHASGGSAAYLSGSGGWGVHPYGMGGTPASQQQQPHSAEGNLSSSAASSRRSSGYDGAGTTRRGRGLRRSFGLSGEEGDEVTEEDEGAADDDEEGSLFELDAASSSAASTNGYDSVSRERPNLIAPNGGGEGGGGGATLNHYPTPLEHLSHVMMAPAERGSRQRGRSVPHTRMGPDGRECILFGAIEVTLPKPEDVEAAEREEAEEERAASLEVEDEEVERVGTEPETLTRTVQGPSQREEEEAESEVANLGPSPPTEDEGNAATTASIPPRSIEAIDPIPIVTTIPPTPAKPTPPPAPTYAWRPLSPLFNSTPIVPPSLADDEDFDLDRTPRPASPSPLPPLAATSSPSSGSSSASENERIITNGLSMLSTSDPSPATPPRSKHAAKRARQNERRRVAASQSSTPPPLALTSNSIV